MGMTSKRRFPVRFPFLHTPPEFCWGLYCCSHNVWPPSAANLLLQVFWRFLSSLFSLFVLYFRISVLRSRQRRPLGSNRDIDSPNGESYQRERVRRGEKPPEGSQTGTIEHQGREVCCSVREMKNETHQRNQVKLIVPVLFSFFSRKLLPCVLEACLISTSTFVFSRFFVERGGLRHLFMTGANGIEIQRT